MKAVLQNKQLNKICRVLAYDTTDSTSSEAKRYIQNAYDLFPTLFIAKNQTAGRGRTGRDFYCREGGGIYMSLLYFSSSPISDIVSITTAASVAVALSIEECIGEKMKIKWVNDIYNNQGKVCGILVETQKIDSHYAVIVGIGINTGKDEFPSELSGIASSIGELDGKEENLILDIVQRLLSHAQNPTDRSYMNEYRSRFMLDGAYVNLLRDGQIIENGQVLGVDDEGGLILLPDGATLPKIIKSGEISLRLSDK